MARIRSLKPEFWHDQEITRLPRDTRLLYMALWNLADEHSRLQGDPRYVKGQAFPYDDDLTAVKVENMITKLVEAGKVERYTVRGAVYLHLPKLAKHQRLDTEKVPSRLPGPDDEIPPPRSELNPDESEIFSDEGEDLSALLYVAGSREQVAGGRELVRLERTNPEPAPTNNGSGTRLPAGWLPDLPLIAWARSEGYPDEFTKAETAKFVDHWNSVPGMKGRKADWAGTWRNWLRRSNPPNEHGARSRAQQETDDLFDRAGKRLGVIQ